MPEEIVVPVAVMDNALEAHAEMDAAAHAQIATTVDEDYTWLTDRLDALYAEVSSLRTQQNDRNTELLTAFQETREQSRTLIEAQTRMIETLTSNLTALSESALLRSLPNDSVTSLQNEPQNENQAPTAETVEVIVPASQEPTAESSAASEAAKKRRRL